MGLDDRLGERGSVACAECGHEERRHTNGFCWTCGSSSASAHPFRREPRYFQPFNYSAQEWRRVREDDHFAVYERDGEVFYVRLDVEHAIESSAVARCLDGVQRMAIVDEAGRIVDRINATVWPVLQDGGRTLKVFIEGADRG